MNAWPDQTSIAQFNKYYKDSWAVAASKGTATAFSGNSGETKSGRITFAFRARDGADTRLVVDLKAADRTRTDVRVSGSADPARPAAAVRGWLDGTSLDCP